MVVVADAGMLSASNLEAIDQAGLRFIVGSRVTRAPHDLAKHFHWRGTVFADGQIIDTITCRRGHPGPPTGEVETRASLGPRPPQQPLAGYLVVLEETRRECDVMRRFAAA